VIQVTKIDRIGSMKSDMIKKDVIKYVSVPDLGEPTRMSLTATTLQDAHEQEEFCEKLPAQEDFKKYRVERVERTAKEKKRLDETMAVCKPANFESFATTALLFKPFEFAESLTKENDFPMPVCVPLCLALRNEVLDVVENPTFDEIVGSGAAAESKRVLEPRWTFDGQKMSGFQGKVGLIDTWQLYCTVCDPYSRYLNLNSMT